MSANMRCDVIIHTAALPHLEVAITIIYTTQRIRYGQMDDGGQSCQNMSEADGKRCKQSEGQRGRAEG